jgi:hypothetical protein
MALGITFRMVRINELFTCNGNTYIKQSARTGKMVSTGRVFYFNQFDTCKV